MLNSIILLGGLVSAFGLGAIIPNQEKQDNTQIRLENHKCVSYNDEEYKITLSADELNNYTWENLYNLLQENNPSVTFATFDYYETSHNFQTQYYNDAYVVNISLKTDGNDNYQMLLNSDNEYKFIQRIFRFGSVVSYVEFEDIEFVFVSTYYSSFKQAIELDIQANQSNINDGIFETLTDSVVAFVGSLGSGIVSMTNIFYDSVNNQLTAIGLLSVIVVAVSLTYFLFRLIIGLIRMRG